MKRLPSKLTVIAGSILLGSSLIFADGLTGWRYYKKVSYENQEEVKAIYLDEEVYRHANQDLSDIRLINEKDEFIPYYIDNGFINTNTVGQEIYTSTEILSYTRENNVYTDYQINGSQGYQDVVGNMLILEVNQDTFYKEIQILGSYDNKTWQNIKTDMIYNINAQEKTQVPLGDSYKYPYYRIISLKDVTKLPISSLTLVYDQSESVYETYEKSKVVDFKVEISKEEKETVLKIHNKDRLKINTIMIKSQGDFNRDYKLYTKKNEEEVPVPSGAGSIYQFNLEDIKIRDTTIKVEEGVDRFLASEYFQIIIDDKDDQPIMIDEIEISYYVDKIVFKESNRKDLQLLFGNKAAIKPNYDIGTYKEELEKSNQEKTMLSDLVKRDVEEVIEGKNINIKLILNICVIIISALLVVLILRRTSKDN